MSRFSAATVEEAANACDLMAEEMRAPDDDIHGADAWADVSADAAALAHSAYGNVPMLNSESPADDVADEWNEAASWLRCGWRKRGDEKAFT